MELDEELKHKITERFLKRLGKPVSQTIAHIYSDLLMGRHSVDITTCGKYTIAEIKYYRDGYIHHFLGISAKNPKDVRNGHYGIKIVTEKALMELISKFYFDEIENKLDLELH